MEAYSTVVVLTLIGGLIVALRERRVERLERLNRESWEALRAARRIHDETARALQAMFEEARSHASATKVREIEK